jgi:dolichyl-phosphate beta-glucosyltransferase
MASPSCHLTIALPVKDGERLLGETLGDLERFLAEYPKASELIVVDDGSRDDTPRILAERRAGSGLVVLTHERNRGKGAALKTAARASSGEIFLFMDADASYGSDSIPGCLDALAAGHDAAIGNRRDPSSRFVVRGRDLRWLATRQAFGWLFGAAARWLTGIGVDDSQCGFKGFRGTVARALFPAVEADGFAFDVELLALLGARGHSIAEVPVTYHVRDQDSTVRPLRDGVRMLGELVRIRRRAARLRRSGA